MPSQKRKHQNLDDSVEKHKRKRNHDDKMLLTPAIQGVEATGHLSGLVSNNPISELELLRLIKNREISQERKIDRAYAFVTSGAEFSNAIKDTTSIFTNKLISRYHFSVCLSEWIQGLIINSSRAYPPNSSGQDFFSYKAHLDARVWAVMKWCLSLEIPWNVGFVSLAIMQALSHVLDETCIVISQDVSQHNTIKESKEDDKDHKMKVLTQEFFLILHDVVQLLLCRYEGVFRPKLDLWVCFMVSCLKIASILCSITNVQDISKILFELLVTIFRCFSNFLKSTPNPRKVFHHVVGKLIENLLSLHGNLRMPGVLNEKLKLLTSIEDILKCALFHRSHLEGFKNVCKLSMQSGERSGNIEHLGKNKENTAFLSYHKLLFQKLDHFVKEGNVSTLGSTDWILRTYIKEAKTHIILRSSNLIGSKNKQYLQNTGQDTEPGSSCHQKTKDPQKMDSFAIFAELISPLLDNFKASSNMLKMGNEFIVADITRLKAVTNAMNSLLLVSKEEHIYAPTDDTPALTNLNFMKDLYKSFIHFCMSLQNFFPGMTVLNTNRNCQEDIQCLVLEVINNIITGIGHIFEIEYRVIEDDWHGIWMTIFSAAALQFPFVNMRNTNFSCVTNSATILASQIIAVFSELRQVERSIFSLCEYLRYVTKKENVPSCQTKCLRNALESTLFSEHFLMKLSAMVREIPEGQVASFLRLLIEDMAKTLKMIQLDSQHHRRLQLSAMKILTDIYICILEHGNVTASNSMQIGTSLRTLMDSILIPYLGVLMDSVTADGDKIANYAKFYHDHENDHNLKTVDCASSINEVNNNERTTVFLAWAFFLRIYMSVKCSHRQCVSLMPPKAAKKASIAIHDPVLMLYTGDYTKMEELAPKECFFSCARKGDISVLDIIYGIHECTEAAGKKGEPLQYILHCIGIQSLADLKRQIRAVHYLLAEMDLNTLDENDIEVNSMKRRTLQKLHRKLKKRSKAITNFLMSWIKRMQILQNSVSWNKVVGNLNDQTLMVAKWGLLCQNIDVWLEFSDVSDLKSFTHVLVSAATQSNNPICNENIVDSFSITSELLNGDSFYEQKVLREILLQEICQQLEDNLCMSNFNVCVESAIHHIQTQVDVKNGSSCGKRWHAMCFGENVTFDDDYRFIFSDMEKANILKCIELMNLVLRFPNGYMETYSAAEFVTSMLRIERFIVLSLLNCKNERCGKACMQLLCSLELLVSCRRCLESLILRDRITLSSPGDFSLISILLRESFSMYWFIVSTDAVARCVHSVVHLVEYVSHKGMLLSLTRCTTGIFTFCTGNLFREYLKPLLIRTENGQTSAISASSLDLNLGTLLSTVGSELKCFSEICEKSESIFRLLIRQEFDRKEQNVNSEYPDGMFSFFYAMSSILWSITETIESFDEKCHLDKGGCTKWSDLFHTELIDFLCSTEKLLNHCMHEFLLAAEVIKRTKVNNEVSGDGHDVPDENHSSSFLGVNNIEDLASHEQPYPNLKLYHDLHGENCGEDNMDRSNELPNPSVLNVSGNSIDRTCSFSVDLPDMSNVQIPFLRKLLSGSSLVFSCLMGELFISMAAILRLKSLLHSPNVSNQENGLSKKLESNRIFLFGGFASKILQEAAVMYQNHDSIQLALLCGTIKYLESVGAFLPYARPTLPPAAVMNFIDMQIRLYGTLASKILQVENKEILEELRVSLRNCFTMFLKRPLVPHFHLALQTIERGLLGFEKLSIYGIIGESCFSCSKENHVLSASIDYLSIIFDSVIGPKRLRILSKYVSRYLAAIFNIIANDHILWYGLGAITFDSMRHESSKIGNIRFPDSRPCTILKCIEILGTVASREVIYPMSACHISQAMNIPAVLFRPFYERNMKQLKLMQNFLTSNEKSNMKNEQLHIFHDAAALDVLVKIYTSSCKLLNNLLKHRRRESGHCIALLGDSLRALLFFLEIMDLSSSSIHGGGVFVIECAIQCAGWLKRIYEEIAEHQETLGAYYSHLLSDYICVISGCGITVSGLSRKIEATIRPGAYALVDSCSTDDLQQLHAVLGEGPRRTALSELRRDYEQHYKYTGKV